MRSIRLYCSQLPETPQEIDLPAAAHRHAIQVLRLGVGDYLRVFNGHGLEYEAELIQADKRHSRVKLFQPIHVENESSLRLTLLQGISRGERMDYALQKAVELGVHRIIPMITARCNVSLSAERRQKRQQHWQGVIISACEQSGRAWVPQLENVMLLADFLDTQSVSCALVLDPLAEQRLTQCEPAKDVTVLIGPEGGLTREEIEQAQRAGFTAIHLGPRILRTETATVATLAALQVLWGDAG